MSPKRASLSICSGFVKRCRYGLLLARCRTWELATELIGGCTMGPTGPKTMHKKGNHFTKQMKILWGCSVSRICCAGVIFQNGFSPKAVQPEASGVWKKSKGPSDAKGSFGDEGPFQECQKPWILNTPLFEETGNLRRWVYFDAEYRSAQFCSVKTSWIAIWGKMNKLQKIMLFSFFTKRHPRGPLYVAIENWSQS